MPLKSVLQRLVPGRSSFASTSLIYVFGLFAGRGLDFALLPLYTYYLAPEFYGQAALAYTLLALGHAVYSLGFSPALLRYLPFHDEMDRRRMFMGATLLLAPVAAGLSGVLYLFSGEIGVLIGLSDAPVLIRLVAGILFFDTLTLLPYTILRSEEQALTFVRCTLSAALLQTGLTVLFLVGMDMSVEGLFIAMLIASICNAALVTLSVRSYIILDQKPLWPAPLLRFGLPFVPATVAMVVLDMIDRILLEKWVDTATVGLYSAGYKIAMVMGLLVKAFEYAYAPYALQRREQSRRLRRRAAGAIMIIGVSVTALFWLFGERLTGYEIRGVALLGPEYRSGIRIAPLIMIAYLLSGIAEVLTTGVYLSGRAWIVPVATVTAAVAHIGINIWLIPMYGMMGAAWATVAGYGVLSGLLLFLQKTGHHQQDDRDQSPEHAIDNNR